MTYRDLVGEILSKVTDLDCVAYVGDFGSGDCQEVEFVSTKQGILDLHLENMPPYPVLIVGVAQENVE